MLPIYTNTVATMSITNRDDDLILRLAKDGTLCKVIGHYFERHTHLTLVYVNGTSECRECRTCKAHQWYYYVEGVWR